MNSIQIHLIRTGHPDDVIQIRPRMARDSYLVVYREGEYQRDRWNHVYDSGEVLTFLDGLLYLLSVDSDPYTSVQITFPGIPAVMLPINRLGNEQILGRVQSLLQQILDHYPAHWVV
jgi:hypothetical protein